MKAFKFMLLALSLGFLSSLVMPKVHAATVSAPLTVSITDPTSVTGTPGLEGQVTALVTNTTDQLETHILVYITMADLTKNMTVNLEDFNASVPVMVDAIQPHETVTVTLPVTYIYPDDYHLYVSAVMKDTSVIASSAAISIHITTLSKLNYPSVRITAFVVPPLLLGLALGIDLWRRKSFQIH